MTWCVSDRMCRNDVEFASRLYYSSLRFLHKRVPHVMRSWTANVINAVSVINLILFVFLPKNLCKESFGHFGIKPVSVVFWIWSNMRLRVRYRISWFMVGFTRVLCFGVITIAKVCARLAVQMWDTNRLRTFYESLSRWDDHFSYIVHWGRGCISQILFSVEGVLRVGYSIYKLYSV